VNRLDIFQEIDFLTGTRIMLKPLVSEMAKDIFAATEESHKELYRFMPRENKTVGEAEEFIELSVKQRHEGTSLNLAIYESDTVRFAGTIGIHKFDPFTPLWQ